MTEDESPGRPHFLFLDRDARSARRTSCACSRSASTSARRPRIWCSRASCWSGSTAATSSPSARASISPTSCSRPTRPRKPSTPPRSAPSSRSQYRDAKVDPDEIDTGALDPDRRRGAPAQRARDRRIVRGAGRQDGRGQRRRHAGNRDGGLRLGRRGALDPATAPR